jgi:hypothetical protein
MAMLEKEAVKKYTELHLWLMYDLHQLPDKKPKVWAAFRRYAGEMAHISIMWGFQPTIKVEASRMLECAPDGKPTLQKDGSYVQKYAMPWYGFTVPTKGIEEIYVASDLARGALSTEVGPVLEATVLHELIHWCRKVVGEDVNDEGPSYAFEKEAYGKTVHRTWQSCMSVEYFKTK